MTLYIEHISISNKLKHSETEVIGLGLLGPRSRIKILVSGTRMLVPKLANRIRTKVLGTELGC